jgi:Spy/CpxP family protein refolding chaperone
MAGLHGEPERKAKIAGNQEEESDENTSCGEAIVKRQVICTAVIFLTALCWGQAPAPPTDDPIAQTLFAPELVMKFHQEINLDDNQSRAIKEAIQKAQTKFLDLQWDMQSEQQKLVQLLKAQPIDEGAALSQVDRLLNQEHEVKKAQLSLLIRIKNFLSSSQQAKLNELRHKP